MHIHKYIFPLHAYNTCMTYMTDSGICMKSYRVMITSVHQAGFDVSKASA